MCFFLSAGSSVRKTKSGGTGMFLGWKRGWGGTARLCEGQQPIWPESLRLLPSQHRLPTAIFTSIFWQVRVIEQAFVIWQRSLWLPCLGSENAPHVVVFNTLLIGPHTNSSCNGFPMIRGNIILQCVLPLMKMWQSLLADDGQNKF